MTDRHDKSSSSPFMRFDLETTPQPLANDDSFAIAAWPAVLRRGGSAGHAGATANLKVTFHLDHSAGADQGRAHSPRASVGHPAPSTQR